MVRIELVGGSVDLVSPAWAALIAGTVAAAGYVGRLLVESWRAWRAERAERLARLAELSALLRAGGVAFDVQRDLAGRLAAMVTARHPGELPAGPGLERLFASLHGQFDRDEADLHQVIRGYTEHAMRPINTAILAWLQSDTEFRILTGKTGPDLVLATKLADLEAHLMLWNAKFHAWFVDQPEHALIYLADEDDHGLGFPTGVEEALRTVLER